MATSRQLGSARGALVAILMVLVIAAAVLVLRRSEVAEPREHASPTPPATRPAAPTTTAAQARQEPPRSYMDVVLAAYPAFPTTQPLGIPLDLREGAHLVLDDPLYLDSLGQLWITRPDAEAVAAVLKRAAGEQSHVLRERVVFVHRSPDARGIWQPQLVCLRSDGGHELVSAAGRQEIGQSYQYDWSRAFSWITRDINAIVVPTHGGVSIIRPDRRPMEVHHAFYPPDQRPQNISPTQVLLDWKGLLAWMPWQQGQTGSRGAARFIDDAFITLDEAGGWPEKILHLVPLLDGGVIQLFSEDHEEYVYLKLGILDPADVDEQVVSALVKQLSHPDPQKRDEAFAELTRYGQGIWPLLERLQPEQLPEAQVRIDQLLAAKIEPTLGGMKLMPGRVRVVTRARGGAALLYCGGGVEVPREDDEPQVVAPAMLAIIPGRSIMLAPQNLFVDLPLDRVTIDIVSGEILVSDDVHGPRWWLSNHYSEPLLRKSELEFRHVLGRDARGRWLFRMDPNRHAPTLIVDPTLPDPTPRLPVWRFRVEGGDVGWTRGDWPAIRRGGAWVLVESEWRPLDPAKEQMILELDPDPPAAPPSEPATTPSTSPSSRPAGPPIFVDADGTRYYDGLETLRAVRSDGSEVVWPLPPEAVGSATVWLVRAGEDRLFLFNEPGRVLRIKPTPQAAEPFELEATFTRRIPSTDNFQRVWVDPAGRIVIAHDIDTLSILFPGGTIPPQIARKIPASELSAMEDE